MTQSQLVVDAAGVDLIEGVLAGFVAPRDLTLHGAPAAGAVEVRDEENTPIACLYLASGGVAGVEPRRELATMHGPAGALSARPCAEDLRALIAAGGPVIALEGFPTSKQLDEHSDKDALWCVTVPRSPHRHDHSANVARAVHTLLANGEIAGRLVAIPAFDAAGPLTVTDGSPALPTLLHRLGADRVVLVGDAFTAAVGELAPSAILDEFSRTRSSAAQSGAVVLFTGLSGSGKSTVAKALGAALDEAGRKTVVIDGDEARQMLSAGLGFDRESRNLNVERIGYVAATAASLGAVAIMAPIAPFESSRAAVRARALRAGAFVLVHISTPLAECERRDRKGLYAKARAGEIPDFTGISSPYEPPTDADIVIDTSEISVDDAVAQVWEILSSKVQLGPYRPAIAQS
ncbi:hypothetical protein GCM10010401_18550 [Rarobacter faecitabidus]|uniref:adenylyl-sulfate kinase n=1 Tax=Rarobacter faecitabidus TaxID=13243 RepID=A0A542ZUL2_RARFA|nr:adenylyl-sulfate kinase [Rarobacter faecitabidus]TQL64065.1 sulfate adenylyltransferase [Rarobacter faecitabidus]